MNGSDFMDYNNSNFEQYNTHTHNQSQALSYSGQSNSNPNLLNNNNNNNTNNMKNNKFRSKNGSANNGTNGSDKFMPESPIIKELNMDDVLDKIRRNRGDKTTWTEDKLRDLTKSR